MGKREFWYSVHDDTRYRLSTPFGRWRDRAEHAADDYHGNHDGWEASWPIQITLYETEEGPPVALFEVARDAIPSFTATEGKLQPPT